MTIPVGDDVELHRLGGADIPNLRLKPGERVLTPPGISVLATGSPEEAVAAMRAGFRQVRKWQAVVVGVATATAAAVRAAGFDVIPAPTTRFGDLHYRIVHADGQAGFIDENLARLAAAFTRYTEC